MRTFWSRLRTATRREYTAGPRRNWIDRYACGGVASRASRPLWRRAFDRAERLAGEPLEDAVQTRTFVDALVLSVRLRKALWSSVEHGTRTALHLDNLPARSDVDRLSRQVAAMRGELREVARRLDDQERER
jgi:hypothetical protein